MKRKTIVAALLSLTLALGLTACGGGGAEETVRSAPDASGEDVVRSAPDASGEDVVRNAPDTSEDTPNDAQNAQIANPFTDYETYAEAEAAAGYAFAAPESVDGYPETSYSVMNGGELFQIIYSNGADEITARKAPGADDISGDYNEYAEETVFDKTDTSFTVRGNDGKAFAAFWTDDVNGYAYSLTDREGMDMDAFSALVMEIQDGESGADAEATVSAAS